MTTTRGIWLRWLIVALVALGFAAWLWQATWDYEWHDDEGSNVSIAALFLEGYHPYTDIRSDQPPLLTALLAGAFRAFGPDLAVGRRLIIVFSLVGLLATAWLADECFGGWAPVLAVVLLALLPPWQHRSRQILQGVPTVSLGLVALASAARFQKRGGRRWLALCGALLAASFWIKPLTPPYYPAIVLWALLPGEGRLRLKMASVWDQLALHLSLLLFALAPFALVSVSAFFGQTVGALLSTREAYVCSLAVNLDKAYRCARDDALLIPVAGMLGLSLLALGDSWRAKRWGTLLSLAVALLATSAALAINCPLRCHQLVLLYPLLALLAADGIEGTGKALLGNTGKLPQRRIRISLGLLAGAILLAGIPGMVVLNWERRAAIVGNLGEDSAERRMVRFLQSHVEPGQIIVTDEPMLAFKSGARVPPSLAVPCYRMLRTGLMSAEQVVAVAKEAQPAAIVLGKRFAALPPVVEWVTANYCVAHVDAEEGTVYLPCRPPDTPVALAGDALAVYAVESAQRAIEAGQTVDLTVLLGAEGRVSNDYTLFVHLLDADGVLCGMADLRPLDDAYRTSRWVSGQRVLQSVRIPVSAEAAAGPLQAEVGFYDADTEAGRLPLRDAAGQLLEGDVGVLPLETAVRWEPRYDVPTISVAQEALFGEKIALVGYDWHGQPREDPQKGGSVEVTLGLYWRCEAAMDQDYKVFVHVVDAEGKLVAQADHDPGQGRFPTGAWLPREYVEDGCSFALPLEAAQDGMEVRVGWYDPASGQRLMLTDATGDYVVLEGIGGG